MAFGHQMEALWAPWLVKLKFEALHAPPSSSCGGLMAFVHLIWTMFVYGFVMVCPPAEGWWPFGTLGWLN